MIVIFRGSLTPCVYGDNHPSLDNAHRHPEKFFTLESSWCAGGRARSRDEHLVSACEHPPSLPPQPMRCLPQSSQPFPFTRAEKYTLRVWEIHFTESDKYYLQLLNPSPWDKLNPSNPLAFLRVYLQLNTLLPNSEAPAIKLPGKKYLHCSWYS